MLNKFTITVEESWQFYTLIKLLNQITEIDSPTAGTNNYQNYQLKGVSATAERK